MDSIKKNKNYIIFILFFIICKIPFVESSFQKMEKINEKGDYFVILDNGLYIYNFENSTCEIITNIESSIFNKNDEYNNIIISKNSNLDSGEIKIAALINHNLYVFTPDNINNKIKQIIITSLIDSNNYIYPFFVKIDNYKLRVYLINSYVPILIRHYYFQSLDYEDYSSIKRNEPKIERENEDYSNEVICQYDSKISIIKCVYPSCRKKVKCSIV